MGNVNNRLKPKPRPVPTWQDIPYHFKKDVVEHLDFRSRISFERCSTIEYFIVQSCPIYLDQVIIKPPTQMIVSGDTFKIPEDQLAKVLIQLFKNPKSFVKEVKFEMAARLGQNYIQEMFLPTLLEQIYVVPDSRIRSRILNWNGNVLTLLGGEFLEVLKYFHARELKQLILYPDISETYIEEISRTEQWKNAIKLDIIGMQKTNIDEFLHFDKLTIGKLMSLNVEDAYKLVQNFIARNPPLRSSFRIYTYNPLEVQLILQKLESSFKNCSLQKRRLEEDIFNRNQHFKVSSEDHILVLKMSTDTFKGVICRSTHPDVDYDQEVCWF